jgi:hypothetical protein
MTPLASGAFSICGEQIRDGNLVNTVLTVFSRHHVRDLFPRGAICRALEDAGVDFIGEIGGGAGGAPSKSFPFRLAKAPAFWWRGSSSCVKRLKS